MRSERTARIVLFAILFLFFLEVLSDFIQSIYAFGLLVTAFTIQLAAVLLLFTPLVLVFVRKPPSRFWIVGLVAVAMLGRVIEPMLDPGGRLVACGVSVGAFMLLFPGMLAIRLPKPVSGWGVTSGLLIAVSLSILFRTAGSSLDISEYGLFQIIAWALAVLAGRLIWTLDLGPVQRSGRASSPSDPAGTQREALSHEERREQSLRALAAITRNEQGMATVAAVHRNDAVASTARVVGLCIGLASAILVLYFAFISPTVIARWTATIYPFIVLGLLLGLVLFAGMLTAPRLLALISKPAVLAWNGLFVVFVVLTILPQQIAFPKGVGGYPLDAPATSQFGQAPLFMLLILWPIVFIDFMLLVQGLATEVPSIRQLGGGFSIAALFMLVMVFLHVFTTIYDYAAPVGPLFRDRFWLVYLIAGLGLALPLLLLRADTLLQAPPNFPVRLPLLVAGFLTYLIGAALFITTSPRPPVPAPHDTLRLMTYNIQQGFDKAGNAALARQLAAMQRVAPDVLGVEESDTARIANGDVDAVRYFSDRLRMYSYYGPTTTVGTFGIALLSKYPIQNPHTFFMYSTGEQTACIQAQITANGRTYNIFVTHLGNDGPIIQLENVLSRVNGLPNVILMGDFNFDPSTPQYALARQTLEDAWLLRWPAGQKIYPTGSDGRIDLMFVSPGTRVTDSEYVSDGSSDHPYLYAVVKP